MFQTLILICAMGTAPSDCTVKTAIDVIPGQRASLQQCMFQGQSLIAPTSVAPEPGKQFAKVVCASGRQVAGAR